jgi:hypothetical protein
MINDNNNIYCLNKNGQMVEVSVELRNTLSTQYHLSVEKIIANMEGTILNEIDNSFNDGVVNFTITSNNPTDMIKPYGLNLAGEFHIKEEYKDINSANQKYPPATVFEILGVPK